MLQLINGTSELRHTKIFVIVIPKEGLAGTNPSKPSFGMILTMKHNLLEHIKGRLGWVGFSQACFCYGPYC